jgi:hypothetical protein
MTLKKNEPIQYQIISYIDKNLKKPIRGYSELEEYNKCHRIFHNFRVKDNKPIGIRLTTFGNSILHRYFDQYKYEDKILLNGKVVMKLDEAMMWPYYLNERKGKVIFYSQEDSAWFKLNGGKLVDFITII